MKRSGDLGSKVGRRLPFCDRAFAVIWQASSYHHKTTVLAIIDHGGESAIIAPPTRSARPFQYSRIQSLSAFLDR